MSCSDPSAATGQQPYDDIGRCTCGHMLWLHVPVGGTRRGCSASTCRCERYIDDCEFCERLADRGAR